MSKLPLLAGQLHILFRQSFHSTCFAEQKPVATCKIHITIIQYRPSGSERHYCCQCHISATAMCVEDASKQILLHNMWGRLLCREVGKGSDTRASVCPSGRRSVHTSTGWLVGWSIGLSVCRLSQLSTPYGSISPCPFNDDHHHHQRCHHHSHHHEICNSPLSTFIVHQCFRFLLNTGICCALVRIFCDVFFWGEGVLQG